MYHWSWLSMITGIFNAGGLEKIMTCEIEAIPHSAMELLLIVGASYYQRFA